MPDSDTNIECLLDRVRDGDQDSLAVLFSRHRDRLWSMVNFRLDSRLKGRVDADDVLQDVWFDVFRKVQRLRDPQAFRCWLYRVTRDRAFRILRRTRRWRQPIEELDLAVEEALEEPFSAEDVERIHAALDLLSPEHREVLVLRFIEDMSYEEVSRVTECGLGTVKSRLHYAKRALRSAMNGRYDHE